ncbi:tripartite tricarboxylate transporter permease [Lutibaculum baratangense]|nr:tripartite tricarboxylate transporter permease [Lutibaculum baratangense]
MPNFIAEFASFLNQLTVALQPGLLLASVVGAALGIFWGAMPALSTTMAMALLIGFSSVMDLNTAIMFLLAVYLGSTLGGSISAVFINIPGTPAAVCTGIEGFPLARKGQGGLALGTALTASLIGNVAGLVFLVFLFPLILALALKIGSWELFLLAVIGILLSGSLTASGQPIKGWISGGLGILISMVGLDPVNAYPRYTFGLNELYGGAGFVPIMIGLFGFAEVLRVLPSRSPYTIPQSSGRLFPPFRILKRISKTGLRSGIIGATIGAIPPLGPDVAAFVCYGVAKRQAKGQVAQEYGHGSLDGIAAAETGNSASIGGTLLPMLAIGIPGGVVAAMYLGALNLHNVVVGPMIDFSYPGLVHFHYAALLVGAISTYVVALIIAKPTIKLLTMPRQVLMPLLVPLCVIGAYASDMTMFGVYVMLVFGVIGYFLNLIGVPPGPMAMGIILGPLADSSFRRAMAIFEGEQVWIVLTRPVGVVLLLVVLWVLYDGFFRSLRRPA